jgi:hypothetical protein
MLLSQEKPMKKFVRSFVLLVILAGTTGLTWVTPAHACPDQGGGTRHSSNP